jgi:YVTN family beta-propeller protein
MKKSMFIFAALLLIGCDNSNPSSDSNPWTFEPGSSENTLWTFVANEGSFGSNNGTVSMIDEFNEVYETEVIGDVVQSIEVYNNKLIVAINVSEKLAIFDISETGLSNWVEVDLSGTPPREIAVVNGRAYVSCWGDSDYNVYGTVPGYLKVVNLETLEVESSIEVGIMPEGLLYDLSNLWVANSGGSTLSKVDVASNTVIETIEVGQGPQNIEINNEDVYVSRRYYDSSWNEFHGSSKISGGNVIIKDYASGIVCGGSVLKFNDAVYRSYDGGIYPLDSELNLESAGRIGEYDSSPYSVEVINNFLWFGIKGDVDENNGTVRVLDSSGAEVSFYNVGIAPGDFAHWAK